MLITDLDKLADQVAMFPALEKALDFLKRADAASLADGKLEIDGDQVYAIGLSYESRLEDEGPTFEAHRKYIDIQYLASGTEIMGWAPLDLLAPNDPYDEEKDAVLGAVPAGEWTPIRLTAGQAMVLYPSDAHAPGLAAGVPAAVKKVVLKFALEP